MLPDLVAVAPNGFESILEEEAAGRILEKRDRLFLLSGHKVPLWAQNVWLQPRSFAFQSISEAAKHLRGIQRSWWPHPTAHHRRATLIQDQLPPVKPKSLEFLAAVPKSPLGSWTLLDENTMLYSAECASPFPDGEISFKENRSGPPSRAYLKLWELFTLTGVYPKPGERVIDLGSSPGGWTWVLDQLGCEVTSVDKAPLDPGTAFSARVRPLNESAFALKPPEPGQYTWMFSDVICYPERLLELVKKWEPAIPNLVCTIKFQGPTDFSIPQEFLKIAGSEIRHLYCNKHELTWWRFRNAAR